MGGCDEVARKVLTVREIYETWFTPDNHESYSADKQLISDPRRGLEVLHNGQPCHQGVFRDYKLNFLNEDAAAKICLAMFPADVKALEHFTQRGVFGKLGGL